MDQLLQEGPEHLVHPLKAGRLWSHGSQCWTTWTNPLKSPTALGQANKETLRGWTKCSSGVLNIWSTPWQELPMHGNDLEYIDLAKSEKQNDL